MAIFNFSIFANSNPNSFRVIMYETNAPNTAVAQQDVAAPHTTSQQVSFTGLNAVSHFVRIYEVVSGALGALLGNYIVYPKEEIINQPANIALTVGIDMNANQNQYVGTQYPQYNGYVLFQDYFVTRRGVGELKSDEISNVVPFGFQLLNGNTFNDEETFYIHFYAKLTVIPATNSSGSGNAWNDIQEVTTNTLITSLFARKIIDTISTTNTAIVHQLDTINNITDMSIFKFINARGLQLNVVIRNTGGGGIVFKDRTANSGIVDEIVLGKGESVELIKKGGYFYVINDFSYKNIGSIQQGYFASIDSIVANGQILRRDIYYRLWKMVQLNLISGAGLVNDADWINGESNKGNFSNGDGVDTFRIPDLRGVFIRNIDLGRGMDIDGTGRAIATYQPDEIKAHDHNVGTSGNQNNVDPGRSLQRSAGNIDQYTSGSSTGYIDDFGGSETRSKNIVLLPLLII